MLISAKILLIVTFRVMYMKTEKESDSWWDCSAQGFGDSGASSCFPQWSGRLSPTNTKHCVLDQGITYYCSTDKQGMALKERTERLGAKRGPGKDECQLRHQSVHLRSLHPSLHPHPPSCPPPQSLLPSSWPVIPQQRKTPLMAQTEASVYVGRTESLS